MWPSHLLKEKGHSWDLPVEHSNSKHSRQGNIGFVPG